MAKSPAKIKAMGKPRKTAGMGDRSAFSLAQLIRKSASAKPSPDPRAKASEGQNPLSLSAFNNGTAKIMQFVVIKTT